MALPAAVIDKAADGGFRGLVLDVGDARWWKPPRAGLQESNKPKQYVLQDFVWQHAEVSKFDIRCAWSDHFAVSC